MLILPERGVARAKIFRSFPEREWREPSQAQSKDCCGRPNRTNFYVEQRCHDGHVTWRGWFDDFSDIDAFVYAAASGSLEYERPLWDLPTPCWMPGYGGDLFYSFTQTTLTTPTGSLQTFTSPSNWTNSSNTIEAIGAGGAGALLNGATARATGGAGGCYMKISNFVFATPGTTTASWETGTGGPSLTSAGAGTAGGNTWFNAASFPGAGTTNAQIGAQGGGGGQEGTSGTISGGTAGSTASSWGQSGNNGGASGTSTGNGGTTGGGGAGGKNAAGNASSTAGASTATAGGQGDGTFGGAGGTANTGSGGTADNGSAGNEWGAGIGSGGGGGGDNSNTKSGAGGNYGAGGGAMTLGSGAQASGAGSGGLIVLTFPLTTAKKGDLFTIMVLNAALTQQGM